MALSSRYWDRLRRLRGVRDNRNDASPRSPHPRRVKVGLWLSLLSP